MSLSGKKILITGATGQVAGPIAHTLARDNEVWCLARFTKPGSRAALEAHGIKTVLYTLDMKGEVVAVPGGTIAAVVWDRITVS